MFLMHEPVSSGRSADGCRERMEAHLRLRQLEESGFEPKNLQEDEEAHTIALERLRKTMAADPKMREILDRAAAMTMATTQPDVTMAEAPSVEEAAEDVEAAELPETPPADEVLEDVYAKLESEGIDCSAGLAGKAKMILQSIVVPVILLLLAVDPCAPGSAARWAIDLLVWITVGVTVISGWPYVQRAITALPRSSG